MTEISAFLANASYVVSVGGPPLADLKYGVIFVPVGEESLVLGPSPDHVREDEFIDAVCDASRAYHKAEDALLFHDAEKDSEEFKKRRFRDFEDHWVEGFHGVEMPPLQSPTEEHPVKESPRKESPKKGSSRKANLRKESPRKESPAKECLEPEPPQKKTTPSKRQRKKNVKLEQEETPRRRSVRILTKSPSVQPDQQTKKTPVRATKRATRKRRQDAEEEQPSKTPAKRLRSRK